MVYLRYFLQTIIWLIVALTECFLLFAGLISQGHDKGRLISIAVAVIIVPVIGYGLHRIAALFFRPSSS